MKKTVKRKVSILMALIMLFLPIANLFTIQAASKKPLNEVKKYIEAQEDSTISVSDATGNKYSILYDNKKDVLTFGCDIKNAETEINVKMTGKANMKGKHK